jgi:hypothetical protein
MSVDTLDEYYSDLSQSINSIEKYYEKELICLDQQEIFSNLTCPICLNVSVNMYVDSCQHPVCSDCFEELFEVMSVRSSNYTNQKCAKCPMCKFILIKDRMKPLRFIKELIDSKMISCEFNKYGCVYKGRFKEYHRNHKKNCIFKISNCKNMFCDFKGRDGEILNHSEICKFQILECKKCKECFIYEAYKKHLVTCCKE